MSSKESSVISDVLRQGGRRDSVGPVLVRFEHGSVDPEAFNSFEVKDFAFQFPKSGDKSSPDVKLDLSAGKMTYSTSAKSVKGRHGSTPYQRTLVAIRNKRTNRVKLVETSTVLLGAMVQPPPTTNAVLIKEDLKRREEAENKLEKTEDDKRQQRVTMNKHLVGLFGQTKGKRAYEQADRMAVESSKLAQKLNQAAMNVSEAAVALPTDLASASDADHLIPKINRQAGLVEDVYKLDDLITMDEMSSLLEAAEELVVDYPNKEAVDGAVHARTFSKMFANHLERFRKSPKLLAASIYIEGILQFLNLRAQAFAMGTKGMDRVTFVPMIVKRKLFHEFTSLQGTVSADSRDKAMCHIIVLALLVNKFQVDFSEITSTFKVKADQIKRLSRLAGASVTTDSLTKTSFIVLKLPLASFDVQAFTKKRGSGRGGKR